MISLLLGRQLLYKYFLIVGLPHLQRILLFAQRNSKCFHSGNHYRQNCVFTEVSWLQFEKCTKTFTPNKRQSLKYQFYTKPNSKLSPTSNFPSLSLIYIQIFISIKLLSPDTQNRTWPIPIIVANRPYLIKRLFHASYQEKIIRTMTLKWWSILEIARNTTIYL